MRDGSLQLVLTAEGRQQAHYLDSRDDAIVFKGGHKEWDGKWRVVIFDIPEKSRAFRAVLRQHLWELQFYKLQQSVFVSPWPYENSLMRLIDFYNARQYVRIMTVSWIDSADRLKRKFFPPKKHMSA